MSEPQAWTRSLPSALRPSPALGFDLVRVYLGIGLVVRGILFVSHPERLLGFFSDADGWGLPYALSHYVAIAHLGGGVLLALGLATRLAAAVQLPILFGAVFLVHATGGLLTAGQSLEFSVLVLVLLSIYLVLGSGKLSLDSWLGTRLHQLEGEDGDDDHLHPAQTSRPPAVLAAARVELG